MANQQATDKAIEQRVDMLKENLRGLVEQGQDKVNEIKTKVIEVKDQAMKQGSAAMDQARETIKAHPLASVGIAFGVGYVAMRIFRR
jgi:ElaB/YqjD/DUF883 family membrane-anchored ribosome-binding protein